MAKKKAYFSDSDEPKEEIPEEKPEPVAEEKPKQPTKISVTLTANLGLKDSTLGFQANVKHKAGSKHSFPLAVAERLKARGLAK